MSEDVLQGMENSAASVLMRAVELDHNSRFEDSLICYQEGIDLLLKVLKGLKDETKKSYYRQKIEGYMSRAEQIKKHVSQQKEEGKYHKQIRIEDNATGYSYEKLFKPYLNEMVYEVWVQDPYVRLVHQGNGKGQQLSALDDIKKSLMTYGVTLEIAFSNSIHDREIRFNNGWMVKIGRGLDYFKKTESRFAIGYCDYDLRQCYETTVDIFHAKHTKALSS
ncbi:MIT domain-containing protein 1 isoform X2 [Protopterus annectens]|uniref:MIT domain-containing protein 1 isoform X2 n=1 Tax=Protopterus annectens TaxID=7888 RepID=UPI001CF977EC|nr:MIT domain-containing protein 1 isoform X2 [Protopterus annectens]